MTLAEGLVLILTIVTPHGQPDRSVKIEVPTIEACVNEMRDFLRHGVTHNAPDAIAIKATCGMPRGDSAEFTDIKGP